METTKYKLQDLILQQIGKMSADAVVLLGSEPLPYVDLLFKHVITGKYDSIISYERDWNKYKNQKEAIGELTQDLQKKIELKLYDIESAFPALYMDIDLEKELKDKGLAIQWLFSKQKSYFKDDARKKVFNFSCIYDGKDISPVVSFLKDMLTSKLELWASPVKLEYAFEYKLISIEKEYKVNLYTYDNIAKVSIQYI